MGKNGNHNFSASVLGRHLSLSEYERLKDIENFVLWLEHKADNDTKEAILDFLQEQFPNRNDVLDYFDYKVLRQFADPTAESNTPQSVVYKLLSKTDNL